MAQRNKKVFELVANMKVPVIAGYDNQSAIPSQSYIGYHKCQECKSSVVVNCLEAPACPVCAGALENVSEDTNVVISDTDFSKLKTLCSCESCGTTWAGKEDTLASLVDHTLYCPACTQQMTVKAGDEAKSDDDQTKPTDSSDKAMPNDSTDTTDADKELDEALKKLKLKDSDDKDEKSDDKTESTSSDDPDDEDEDDSSTDDKSDDNDDDDEEADASDLIYAMALKEAKNIAVVSSKNFANWYMFNDKTPIAIAEFEKAQASVQSIFRSPDYVVALESAINNDGGINDELMKDFGFEPVKIDLNINNLQKKIIEEEVANKTKQAEDKVASLSEYYDQAVGIAAVGITKGLYDNGDDFRTALISGLASNNVRNPEMFVDDFLAKNLPDLMKNTISLAKDLMDKTPEALSEVAAMVVGSKARTVSFNTSKEKAKIPAIAIHSNEDIDNNDNENREKRNLKRERVSASEKEAAHTVSGLFSHVKTRINN